MDIGIIGGADGPTAVFITGSFGGFILLCAGLVLAGALAAFFVIRRRRKK